uniref:LytR family transcriptional regulator n=1 Tax=Bellilinea caldifistulae TaxID=360411 RepID=A0A7C4KZ25_9CHLR
MTEQTPFQPAHLPETPLRISAPLREVDPNEHFQAIPVRPAKKHRRWGAGCWLVSLPGLGLLAVLLLYFFAPLRTNILILGIDRAPDGSAMGRSDTNILLSINPLQPDIKMLSIPRDLWVNIPGVGENRINTAHFFAEIDQPGSGPRATLETVRVNFGLDVPYFVRLRFDSVQPIVEAMGGITIELEQPTAGYPPGRHTLNGEQALAFARNRTGTDDFYRMAQGQLLFKAAFRQMLNPASWSRLPAVTAAALESVDTNLPVWLWPRLGLALLRAGPDGIDNRTLDREMVTPFTTSGGANVLLPNWERINPLLQEMFGR